MADHLNEDEMRAWASAHPGKVNDLDEEGNTLLGSAAARGVITWLVQEKGCEVDGQDDEDRVPLHRAIDTETISTLLGLGADPEMLSSLGWTPLMFQCTELATACVERLLQDPRVVGAIDTQAEDGQTAFHTCHYSETRDDHRTALMIELLLDHGADPFLIDDESENTVLELLEDWKGGIFLSSCIVGVLAFFSRRAPTSTTPTSCHVLRERKGEKTNCSYAILDCLFVTWVTFSWHRFNFFRTIFMIPSLKGINH
jgi:hypothetical protein